MNMQVQNNMVGWFEIHVDNMERAKKFYQGVFSREMIDLPSENKETQMCMFYSSGDVALGATGALVKSNHLKPGIGGKTKDTCTILYESHQAREVFLNSKIKNIILNNLIKELIWQ
jgi:predicted enzyme related to lactoylglutathione lyase